MTRGIGYWVRRLRAVPPFGIRNFHLRALIHRPRLIENAGYISLGRGAVVREHGWLSAIPEYAGVRYSPKLEIGDGAYIGRHVCITCIDHVRIGNGCVLSEHVYVADSAHGIDPDGGPIMRQRLQSKGPVLIGEGSFIGYGARILSGVTLGQHCVVGSNAVVTRSFGDYMMVAGVPARAIKRYNPASRIWEPAS